jgi:hypothetical protein
MSEASTGNLSEADFLAIAVETARELSVAAAEMMVESKRLDPRLVSYSNQQASLAARLEELVNRQRGRPPVGDELID